MTLCPPSVVGPISPCVNSVRVQNQISGSTVAVFRNGAQVAGGLATSTDQTFNLNAGVTLNPGDKIRATQSSGGSTSNQTPTPVVVQQKPVAPLNPVTFASPVLNCSNALLISGAVPGANITLTDQHGTVRGTGVASQDGSVGIGIAPQLGHGEVLHAAQSACGLTQHAPNPSPAGVEPPLHLPPLVVQAPLYACGEAVTVSGVVPGAKVTLTRTAGPTESGAFVVSAEYFSVPPLKPLETVTASQAFPHCRPEVNPAKSPPVKVGRAQPPHAPVVIGPLCPGALSVRLTGLTIGDSVEIFQNGTSIGEAGVAKATGDFYVSGPLVATAVITARQSNQCAHRLWSVLSNAVTVNAVAAPLTPPALTKPLFECTSVVNVTDIHPGCMVQIESAKNGLIGFKTVYAVEGDIPVAPQLVTGDKITALQIGCGQTSGPSPVAVVQALSEILEPPVVLPITNCARVVRVSNVSPGAIVDVFLEMGTKRIWLASATATLPTFNVALGAGVELAVGDVLAARQRLCSKVSRLSKPETVTQGVCSYTTQHFDNGRTGWSSYETTLTPDSVSRGFGMLALLPVNGQVFAQPLYLRDVVIGGTKRNLLIVATATDWIYAFDADTFVEVWPARELVQAGGRAIPSSDAYKGGPGEPTYPPDIQPTVGIIGTPVIDRATLTMYVVATSQGPLIGSSRTTVTNLHAIDLTTGNDRVGSPVPISAQFPPNPDGTPFGDGTVTGGFLQFDPTRQMQRPGLLLTSSKIFIGFGSYGDFNPWHGWLMAYDAVRLHQVGYFNTTPDQVTPTPPDAGNNGGAIWQGGFGIASDRASLFFSTGNGPFNASGATGRNYGDSVLRFSTDIGVGADLVLPVADYFSPWNQFDLCGNDGDVGSGGVLLVPQKVGGKDLLVQCGKSSQVFVLDRGNLGNYAGPPPNLPPPSVGTYVNNVVDDKYTLDGGGVWGGPGFYRDSSGNAVVFYCGTSGHLNRLTFGAQQQIVQSAQTTDTFQSGNSNGFTVTVSSNASNPGTGIAWLVDRNNLPSDPNVRLFAYDADTLQMKLVEIPCGSWTTKGTFTDPTVVDGRVFVGSDGKVTVLGLDPALGPT